MVEPNLADPSKKTEVPSGPHLLHPARPSGQPGGPAQTRDESVADPLIPVTAPAATGPDTGTALTDTTSRREAFARRPKNKGSKTHDKSKQAHEEKKEKHRLRLIAKAATAMAAGTSSAEDDEDGEGNNDSDEYSVGARGDEDSDADDEPEQDVDAPRPLSPPPHAPNRFPPPGKVHRLRRQGNAPQAMVGGPRRADHQTPSRPLTRRHRQAAAGPRLLRILAGLRTRHRPVRAGLRRVTRPPRRRQRTRRRSTSCPL